MYGKNLTFKAGGVDGCEAYLFFENKCNGVIKAAAEC